MATEGQEEMKHHHGDASVGSHSHTVLSLAPPSDDYVDLQCTSCKGQLFNLGCPTCTPRAQTRPRPVPHERAHREGEVERGRGYNKENGDDLDQSASGLDSLLSHRTLLSSVVHPFSKQKLPVHTGSFLGASSLENPPHTRKEHAKQQHHKSPPLMHEPEPEGPKPLVYFKTGSTLTFGPVATPCGCTSRVKVGLVNRGYRDLQVELSSPALPFVLLHESITLKARSFVNLPVRFSPLAAGSHESVIVVSINERKANGAVDALEEAAHMGGGMHVKVARLRLFGTAVASEAPGEAYVPVVVKHKHD